SAALGPILAGEGADRAAAGGAARGGDISPALVLAVAVSEVGHVLFEVVEAVLFDRYADFAGEPIDNLGMVRSRAELGAGYVVGGRLEPARVAGRGQHFLCLRDVVLVVLRVGSKVLGLGIQPPALIDGREGSVPAGVHGKTLVTELRDVEEGIHIKV